MARPIYGEFIWLWGQEFFIKTEQGNFVWNDPDYGGDNTIRKYEGTLQEFLDETGCTFGRGKGIHDIERYCGDKVIWV